jgi:hypothetical protein
MTPLCKHMCPYPFEAAPLDTPDPRFKPGPVFVASGGVIKRQCFFWCYSLIASASATETPQKWTQHAHSLASCTAASVITAFKAGLWGVHSHPLVAALFVLGNSRTCMEKGERTAGKTAFLQGARIRAHFPGSGAGAVCAK